MVGYPFPSHAPPIPGWWLTVTLASSNRNPGFSFLLPIEVVPVHYSSLGRTSTMPTPHTLSMRAIFALCLLFSSSLLHVSAQSSTSSSARPTSTSSLTSTFTTTTTTTTTPTVTVFPVTTAVNFTTVSQAGSQNVTIATAIPTVFNATSTLPTPTSTASATATSTPIVLSTKITPAFGVLGAILILTGLPSAFWGHKNRW